MRTSRVNFLFFFIIVLCSPFGQGREFFDGPYFWQKPDIQMKMKKERYVPVSVIKQNTDQGELWTMKGAGLVLAPCEYTFDWMMNFETLKKMKDHFPEVSWNKEKTELNLSVRVLARTQKIKFQLWKTASTGELDEIRKLHYKVKEGAFSGSEGVILLKNALHQQCEVGLIGQYQGKLIAFGGGVFAIAVEGLLQHVAKSLRTGVENDWTQSEFTKRP